MGIKGLGQWIRKQCPQVIHEIPLSCFNGQRIAVDASVYLYKFICITNSGQGNYFDMFLNLILWLRKNNIRPFFVFDGPPPPEKDRTKQERKANKLKLENKINALEDIVEELELLLQNVETPSKKQLKNYSEIVKVDLTDCCVKEILDITETQLKKSRSQCINITARETNNIKDLLTYLGLPFMTSEYEAEKTCSWLCKWGYVKAVLTADSDVLAYNVPIFLQDVGVNKPECKIIRFQDLIDAVGLTAEEFIDFCIMCGTDYNNNVSGIGPAKAYSLIQKYSRLEEIEKSGVDTSVLYYKDGRRLFTLPENDPNFQIPFITDIQENELDILLFKNNSRFRIHDIKNQNYTPKFKIKV